jgi:hypothetical protein
VRGEGGGTTVTTLEALLGERIDTGSVPSCL